MRLMPSTSRATTVLLMAGNVSGIGEEGVLKLRSSVYPLKLIREMKFNIPHHPFFWQCLVIGWHGQLRIKLNR